MVVVPPAFAAGTREREGDAGARWVAALPALVERLLRTWHLDVDLRADGPVLHGTAAIVVPVRRHDGTPAALKASWVDDETRDEARALRRWAGRGAVAVLEAAPEDGALLLERLDPSRSLQHEPEDDALAEVGALLRQLHVAPPEGLRTTADLAARWALELPARAAVTGALDNGALARVVDACRALAAGPAPPVLVHGDLHFANALARPDGSGWAAIDPKPLAGDGEHDLLPLLRNRWDELVATGDVRRACRRRLDALVDHSGADPGRAHRWALVRAADDATWGAAHGRRALTAVARTIVDALS